MTEANDSQRGNLDAAFASGLRSIRTRAGLSQEALAEAMAERGFPFHVTTVGRIERGDRRVSVGEALALSAILDTTVDVLAGMLEGEKNYLHVQLYDRRRELELATRNYIGALVELADFDDEFDPGGPGQFGLHSRADGIGKETPARVVAECARRLIDELMENDKPPKSGTGSALREALAHDLKELGDG